MTWRPYIGALAMLLALLIGGGEERSLHFAVRYNPGVMEKVARNRGLPIVDCMIAHPTLPIGAWVWIEGQRTGAGRRCRVTDSSMPRDKARHIRTKRIELDYGSSRAVCGASWQGKATECPVALWKEE